MMTKSLFRFALVGATLAALVSCKTPSKKHGAGSDGDASLSGSDLLNPNDVTGNATADRIAGFNPETDVDYNALAPETVYFAFDSSGIQPSERGKLDRVKKWLDENAGKKLFLAGHTDSRGTLEYNRGLGERRALAVRDYLIGLGIDGSHLQTISYGEEKPAAQGENEAAWAQNRRVQIGVITK
jgi:peptidoglycan-associated lipoprotein